jgi:hypothetical protein
MAAPEPTLNTTAPIALCSSLPPVFRAIEYNIPPNYRRQYDDRHGHFWIYRAPKTRLSAHIYPNVDHEHDSIKISIFDDSKNADLTTDGGELIKKWSTQLRMSGKWRRRLRWSTGEALVLVNQRPRCPSCKKPLIVRERRDNHHQFFGCEDYPRCNGSISIIDHDVDRNKAASYRPPSEHETN